jgi:hypothetical protein
VIGVHAEPHAEHAFFAEAKIRVVVSRRFDWIATYIDRIATT